MRNWHRFLLHDLSFSLIKMDRIGRLCAVTLGIWARRWPFVSALTVCCLISPALALADSGVPASTQCLIPQGETSITRATDLTTGQSFMDTTRITFVGDGNPPVYVVRRTGGGKTTLIWMSGNDLQPSRYQLLGSDGNVQRQIDFSEQALRITGKVKGESKI